MEPRPGPEELLPLKSEVLWLLLSLLECNRHGYGLMRDVEDRTQGTVRIQTGALYRLLHRMEVDGLIGEVDTPADATDERRVYYGVTPFGRQVAVAELERMRSMIAMGKRQGLLVPGRTA